MKSILKPQLQNQRLIAHGGKTSAFTNSTWQQRTALPQNGKL